MNFLTDYIEHGPLFVAWLALLLAFVGLTKFADMFVESAVAIAEKARIPKIVIGIVLVSLATTTPEVSVSVLAALSDSPEMALGNAIGSVICNCGLALALCGAIAVRPIHVLPNVLRWTGGFLLGTSVLIVLFVLPDRTLNGWEGGILVLLCAGYIVFLIDQRRRGKLKTTVDLDMLEDDVGFPLPKLFLLLGISLVGIVLCSRIVIASAIPIALSFHVPESAIALTLVAFGTSVPEVATSIVAARKGEGDLAVGNILGANIMNICWVAGTASLVSDLVLTRKTMLFMFPAMFLMVGVTLLVLKTHQELRKKEGVLLFGMYVVYLAAFLAVFKPSI